MVRTFFVYATTLWFCSICFCANAQGYQKGDFVVSGTYQNQFFKGQRSFDRVYGLNAQYFIADRWALEYNLSYVNAPYGINYFKVYGGGLVAGYGLSVSLQNISNDGYLAFLLLSFLLPEGISYHIPVNERMTISPYLNVLTFDISDSFLHYSNSVGVRMNMLVREKLSIAPFMYLQLQHRARFWGGMQSGFGMGVMAGWRF